MNRRIVVALSRASSPALMLAMGLATIGSGFDTQATDAVGAARTGASSPIAVAPMRMRPPHEVDSIAAVTVSPSPPVLPVVALTPGAIDRSAAGLRLPVAKAAPSVVRLASAAAPARGGGGRFTYGYCTWWVAQKRSIPWLGNAWQWWGNARAYGFAEGSTPRPGAIMVMGIGPSSPQGHVAYVESVAADGSFTVSEMNWWGVPGGGWGRVDVRHVTSMRGVVGFIY